MSLIDTGKAIRKVTELVCFNLKELLKTGYGLELTVEPGRPEPPGQNGYKKRLNVFLYEASFDASLKNVPLQEGFPEPLWLVLHYLLTAYDDGGESDTPQAYEYLGEGIRALQQLNYLELTVSTMNALKDNPEPLKITFNYASAELLSKLMQGGDEKYRFSMAFEVRPVLLAFPEPPASSLLVGIDYTKTPPQLIETRERGVDIQVIPGLGPQITAVTPVKFEVQETLGIKGNNFDLAGLSVWLGSVELPITDLKRGQLAVDVNGTVAGGSVISAGSHPLKITKTIPGGRIRSSNIWPVNLLPTLNTVQKNSLAPAVHPDEPATQVVKGDFTLKGILLGGEKDDIILSFYQEGKVVNFMELKGGTLPGTPQEQLQVTIEPKHKVLPGNYRFILLVNGQQARKSPLVDLTLP